MHVLSSACAFCNCDQHGGDSRLDGGTGALWAAGPLGGARPRVVAVSVAAAVEPRAHGPCADPNSVSAVAPCGAAAGQTPRAP
jgi:hypothetical protein